MSFRVFANNPGSTSTKLAVYNGLNCEFSTVINHSAEDLKAYTRSFDQIEYRYESILKIIEKEKVELQMMDAFVGRGGFLKPLKGGTYIVNKDMLEELGEARYGEHASNLGAVIAFRFASQYGKDAYIVDPPVVDELMEEARYTGLPDIRRTSKFHALNQKAAAKFIADEIGMDYEKSRFIVAHLGGGISIGVHENGSVIDVTNALSEGPFSPERAGVLPNDELLELCLSGRYSKAELKKLLVGRGGLFAYTGTTDFKKLEELAYKDQEVMTLVNAFIYRIAREICGSAAAVMGRVDRIVLTGGLARSRLLTEGISRRVSFLAGISVVPGEREMAALAQGVIRVLDKKEEANIYKKG